jgi:acyl-CoA dehydrogenase
MVDFALSDEQKELQNLSKEFAQKEIRPVAHKYDETGEFPINILKKGWEIGLLNATVPEKYGGAGLGSLDAAIIAEEISWGCPGIGTSLMCNALALEPILIGGSEEQKEKFLTLFCKDFHLASFCLTEREAGSDVASISTKAEKKGGKYIINGSKCFITNAAYAHYLAVFAVTDKSRGARGISVFWVPAETEGISVGKHEDKMGQRASNTAELFFDNVVLPADHLIGREGIGFVIALKTFNGTRPLVGAASVGIAKAAFEHALSFAKSRKQFGSPILRHQAIAVMLSEMKEKVEAARLLVHKAAWMSDKKMKNTELSGLSKAYASDIAMQVTTDAVQIFGGYGYMKDYPIEKLMRDAKLMQIYEGTNQILRLFASSEL